jgi:polysaccharide biosynthesis transport protein
MNSRPLSQSPRGPFLNECLPGLNVASSAVIRRVSANDADFSLREFWRILLTRKRTILKTIVVLVLLSLLISLLMTPKYEAVSTIEVNKENSDMLGLDETGAGAIAPDSLDYNITLQTQANVLQTDSLAFQVSEQLGLERYKQYRLKPGWFNADEVNAEFARALEKAPLRRAKIHKAFERNLKIKTIPGTRMIEVHFLDPDPQVAADVANTLVSDYLEQYFRTRYNATAQASEWLSKQLEDLKSQVEGSQEKLNQLQKQAGILGTDEANNVVMTKLEELNKQLTAAEANRILKQAVYQIAQSADPELISSMASSTLIGGSVSGVNPNSLALIQTLRAQEASLKVQLAQARTKYGPNYPKLIETRNQLLELEESIRAETDKLAARAQNDFLAAKSAESLLRASFEQQKEEANKLNDSAVQYTILKREVESGRELYEDLLKKLKEGGVLAGLRSTNIVVVDPARTSAKPKWPNYPLNLALGLAVGLLGGVALAFAREALDDTIRTPEQVEAAAALVSIGLIPECTPNCRSGRLWRKKPGGNCNVLGDPTSPMAEAYRSLRTALVISSTEPPPKVLLVTSALPQEGKTTTSFNAAVTLAQQGSKVLLIDADLRQPAFSSNQRFAPVGDHGDQACSADCAGLSGLLASDNGLAPEFVQHPAVPNLSILPAGKRPPYPAELLGSPRTRQLIAELRSRFDFIVIDSPPVLPVTDPVVLSAAADAVLLVVRSERTKTEALLRARELLLRANAKIAGVLVNRINPRSPGHYLYCGYYQKQEKA